MSPSRPSAWTARTQTGGCIDLRHKRVNQTDPGACIIRGIAGHHRQVVSHRDRCNLLIALVRRIRNAKSAPRLRGFGIEIDYFAYKSIKRAHELSVVQARLMRVSAMAYKLNTTARFAYRYRRQIDLFIR